MGVEEWKVSQSRTSSQQVFWHDFDTQRDLSVEKVQVT